MALINLLTENLFLTIAITFLFISLILSTNQKFIEFDEKLENLKKKKNPNYPYGKDLSRFNCPLCQSEISRVNRLKNVGNFFKPKLSCPNCHSIVKFNTKSSSLLNIGILIGIIGMISMEIFPSYDIFGLIIAVISLAFIFRALAVRELVMDKNEPNQDNSA